MNDSQNATATRDLWIRQIGTPIHYEFSPEVKFVKKYEHEDFTGELYYQNNGPGTRQRVLLLFPKKPKTAGKLPAVVVPFYYPEGMVGFELDTGKPLPYFAGIEMMLHLVRRGYAVISADAYHLTYLKSDRNWEDFQRWKDAGRALKKDHPEWTGIGKLTADTQLLIDLLAADPRIDAERIGIAGLSLGGKMAFYTGCLDRRIKVIVGIDFGIGWDQTNWNDIWYWGDKVQEMKQLNLDHSSLLGCAAPKPFYLIAGHYDNQESWELMLRAPGYSKNDGRLGICNHASGHRPPAYALEKGYDFLDQWLR